MNFICSSCGYKENSYENEFCSNCGAVLKKGNEISLNNKNIISYKTTYSEPLSTSKPGLIIIMVDQSLSMEESYGSTNKANFASIAVNRIIGEIIFACSSGENVKDRCFVAVIGYASEVNEIFLEKTSDLARNEEVMTIKKSVSDGAGGLVEIDEILRVFVKPIASGGTDMTKAFQRASIGIKKFISQYPHSFPPIIINITDGEPNDFTTATAEAKKLAKLKTTDGNVILLNAHIASKSAGKIELPNNNDGFKNDKFAQFLFEISSVLPDKLAQKAKDIGFNVQNESRGFVFNADAPTLIKILNFGSLGALR